MTSHRDHIPTASECQQVLSENDHTTKGVGYRCASQLAVCTMSIDDAVRMLTVKVISKWHHPPSRVK